MSSVDLEDTITSAIEDAVTSEPADVEVNADPDPVVETPTESAPEATPEPVESTTTPEPVPEVEAAAVASPTARVAAQKPEQDDFEKKFGIPRESSPGRENRIPYSRVTKIVGKAAADAKKEAESTFTPRIAEYETKVKDYESRLTQAADLERKVAEFEKVMVNDQDKFITMLKQIPGYEKYFQAPSSQPQAPEAPVTDDMPQPDQELSDGSKVYSMDGLKALNAWNRTQARKETLAEIDKVYGPIAKSHAEQEKQAQFIKYQNEVLIPQVNAQIQEAHTWPLFKENEAAIVKVLNENPSFNLERAYQVVCVPLFQANRDSIRKQVIADLKKAPTSTSAPISGSRPQAAPVKSGPRDLEDIIRDQVATLNT